MDSETKPRAGHIPINPPVLYVGTPVALITTLNPDGTTNISPMSSCWALAYRVVLGMSSTSQGCGNALRERELVINFPASAQWAQVEAIARATGRDPVPAYKAQIGYAFHADKFELSGFTSEDAETVRPQRVAECPIQFEAEVVAAHEPGGSWPEDRPTSFRIIEVKVTRVHADQEIVIPGTDHIDTARWSPLLYVFRHYFGTGPSLGRTFKA